jgi:hypothetical protein
MEHFQALITAPLPSHCTRLHYSPLTYANEPPPPMLVSELLPRDANNAEEYYKNLRLAEKRQAEERTATGPKKGFMASLRKSVKDVGKNIGEEFSEISVEKGSSEASFIAKEESFRSHFRLPWEERLWESFHCKIVVSQGFNRAGKCYISDNYFSFTSTHKHEHLAFMIPLKEIVSFRAAVETGKKHTKQLVAADLPTETIRGLIIYTSDRSMHRFYHFHPDSRSVYNVLDHAWYSARNSLSPLPMPIPLQVMFPARPAQNVPYESLKQLPGSQLPVAQQSSVFPLVNTVPPSDLEHQNNNWNFNNSQVVPSEENIGSGPSEVLTTRTIYQYVPGSLQNQQYSPTKILPTENANVSEQKLVREVPEGNPDITAYQG